MHPPHGRGLGGAGADRGRGNESAVAQERLRGIYAIVDATTSDDPEADVDALLRGGIRLVQYRAKAGVDRALVRILHRRTRATDALLIVNDDVAAASDADGLHVGQEDLAELGLRLRTSMGSAGILGISCGVAAEAVAAKALGADYIGVGPFAQTSSKADAGPAIGAAGIEAVARASGGLPVAAIGGIGHDDLVTVAAAGATMAALISALRGEGGIEACARRLVARWNEVAR